MLDLTDLAIIGALYFDPRSTIETLAFVAEVSPSTASRRLKKLLDTQAVRIVGEVAWPLFSSTYPVHIWVRVYNTTGTEIARRISDLHASQHVATLFGSEPVFATLNCESEDSLISTIDEIQRMQGVASVFSLPILQWATKASSWNPQLLSDDQLVRFHEIAELPQLVHVPLTPETDYALSSSEFAALKILQEDGRYSATDLSRLLHVSVPTAQRLIARLMERGLFRPRVECNLADIGLNCRFLTRIQVQPQSMEYALQEAAAHPAHRFVTQVGGDADIFAVGVCTDRHTLARIVNDDLANITGVRSTRTDIIAQDLKRYWTNLEPGGGLGAFNPPVLLTK